MCMHLLLCMCIIVIIHACMIVYACLCVNICGGSGTAMHGAASGGQTEILTVTLIETMRCESLFILVMRKLFLWDCNSMSARLVWNIVLHIMNSIGVYFGGGCEVRRALRSCCLQWVRCCSLRLAESVVYGNIVFKWHIDVVHDRSCMIWALPMWMPWMKMATQHW